MANAANKARRSAAKDARQMPAPEPNRAPGKNKRTRPFAVWERLRFPEGHWGRLISSTDAEGWRQWRRAGRYRTLEEAETALEGWRRKHRGSYELQLEIRNEDTADGP